MLGYMSARRSVLEGGAWLVGICATILALYLIAYFLSAQRKVARGGAQPSNDGGTSEYFSVSCSYRPRFMRSDLGLMFFAPARYLDSRVVRPRYWSGWYEVTDPAGTNHVFDFDRQH